MYLYSPQETLMYTNTSRWGDQVGIYGNHGGIPLQFECHRSGLYHMLFSPEYNESVNVDLRLYKWDIDTDEVFFIEQNAVSVMFGGMSSVSSYRLPSEEVEIGKSYYFTQSWVERSVTYTTVFLEDEEIEFEYNATRPITIKLTGPGKYSLTLNGTSNHGTVRIPHTGAYKFKLSNDEQAYASFECHRTSTKNLIGDPRKPIVYFNEYRETTASWIPEHTPQKLNGSLGITSFTTLIRKSHDDTSIMDHDVITLETENRTYILHIGSGPECIPYPEGGDNLLSDLSLWDIVNAYELNLSVCVSGFPFTLTRDNIENHLFHVNEITLADKTQLPLMAMHSLGVVSGRFHWGNVNETLETSFPISFETGYTTYDYGSQGNIYGNQEHQFKIHLIEGEKIKINVNASNPIEFKIAYLIGNINFQLHDDYLVSEDNVTMVDMVFTATETGSYNIAIRGFSGAAGNVTIDCKRLE